MALTKKQVISGYHRPVCPECNCEMRPEKNGVGVLDIAVFGPCNLYAADLWKCPRCDKLVIGGFGHRPIASHYEDDFLKTIEDYKSRGLLYRNTG